MQELQKQISVLKIELEELKSSKTWFLVPFIIFRFNWGKWNWI
jgi:hypothetical protein